MLEGQEFPILRFHAEKGFKSRIHQFQEVWQETYEDKALKLVEQYTGLPWKSSVVEINATRPKSAMEKAFLGDTDPQDPSKIRLFSIGTKRSWEALVHELIHSNIWAAYLSDLRLREPGLFEDIFCDEILTELIAQKICISLKLRARMDYRWALEYGFETAFDRIADILGFNLNAWRLNRDRRRSSWGAKKLRGEGASNLEKWFKDYVKYVRRGEMNALKGRREILKLFPNISELY